MPSYEATQDEVVGALRREGGELSYPELVSATKLPQELVGRVVAQLKDDGRVEITELQDDVRLVRLHRGPFGRAMTKLFGSK